MCRAVDDDSIALQIDFYRNSCPEAESIAFSFVENAVSQDSRMAASLLLLLDDTEYFVGTKTAPSNSNSLRGFKVIDAIKQEVEPVCPQTAACADILATAARDCCYSLIPKPNSIPSKLG
ncbi:peroxidase 40-like [Hibiscus syriacus]|uniref:peroxidase 40-like n=1 Tax=Hibiscus syriacus TaxID=106335 RepID=UPI001922519D|nr:peroxidase 40-like [Hibiscus syriacus]